MKKVLSILSLVTILSMFTPVFAAPGGGHGGHHGNHRILWRGDKGVTRTPVVAGKTLNVYAIWKKTGASVAAVNRTFAQATADQSSHASSGENVLMKFLPGYYSGELADGTGMYDLLVDESGETGYVHIFFDDGSAVSGEVEVDFLGDIILATDEADERYQLMR